MDGNISARAHHQEVSLGIAFALQGENATALQVFWQRNAEMGIVEHAEIVRLSGISSADLARLDGQFGLSEPSPFH